MAVPGRDRSAGLVRLSEPGGGHAMQAVQSHGAGALGEVAQPILSEIAGLAGTALPVGDVGLMAPEKAHERPVVDGDCVCPACPC
ncbi:MAG TPA: hypothetical protein VMV92_41785 [Streptosporangiaceae bacterium]|nr:hypothetical protein [Streptosporangiaceae bacterium]